MKLVSIWNGNGHYLKTYRDGEIYYTVAASPDFTTREEAEDFQNRYIDFSKTTRG